MTIELTKKTHACIRLEKDGRTLVIDPGGFSEADAALGADAILVTHEHPDHFDENRLRAGMEANPTAQIWTLRSVAEQLSAGFPGRVHTVGHGDTFEAAGFDIQVHGELHAVIHRICRGSPTSAFWWTVRSSTPVTPSPFPISRSRH